MGQSYNNYPRGNGLAKSTNKTLVQILQKTICINQRDWHNNIFNALWESLLTPKSSTGHYPFSLVYGKDSQLHSFGVECIIHFHHD
jgi:hypothetical protein